MSASFHLSSPAFTAGEAIPSKYTCDGADVSPPLTWGPAPTGAKSLALIVDDPDAPSGIWTHWILFNLPATAQGLRERVTQNTNLPRGAVEGTNNFNKVGYGGPCPPNGRHRYFFHLYALDSTLALPKGAHRQEVEKAMSGHIVAQTELIGTYSRSP